MSFSPIGLISDGLILLVFVLLSYAGVFVQEKVGWAIMAMAGVFSAAFLKGIVPVQYVWPSAICYLIVLAALRIYCVSDAQRGQRFNNQLIAVLDRFFLFVSGTTLTKRVQGLKEWSDKKQLDEKNRNFRELLP